MEISFPTPASLLLVLWAKEFDELLVLVPVDVAVMVATLPSLSVTVATDAVAVAVLLVVLRLVSMFVLLEASMLSYEPVMSVQL